MATHSTTTNNFISTISGYCVYGQICVGDDSTSGTSEFEAGGNDGSNVAGEKQWDGTYTDGFDSGWVDFEMDVNAGGGSSGVNVELAGGVPSPITYTGATYGSIQQVRVRAGVIVPAQMLWRSVNVQFYKAGIPTESYNVRSGPQVDTSTSSSPVAKEQILSVIPGFMDNDKVVITGQVRLVNAAHSQPGNNDMFGQVYVDTSSCTIH